MRNRAAIACGIGVTMMPANHECGRLKCSFVQTMMAGVSLWKTGLKTVHGAVAFVGGMRDPVCDLVVLENNDRNWPRS